MAKLPRAPDPDRLRATPPSVTTLGLDLTLHRIYRRGGPYPTLWNTFRYFGPLSRFDHHRADDNGDPCLQESGTLYAATDIVTAIAEAFQHNQRLINRTRRQPWLVSFRVARELRLLDLTDTFCVRVGGSAKLANGPFSYAQAWSRGFYDAYPDIDGLLYRSSLTNRPAVVLCERADIPGNLPERARLHRALADPTLHSALSVIADEIGYGLV